MPCTPNVSKKTNPAVEVFHLSGWIPEYLDLATIHEFDDFWERIN